MTSLDHSVIAKFNEELAALSAAEHAATGDLRARIQGIEGKLRNLIKQLNTIFSEGTQADINETYSHAEKGFRSLHSTVLQELIRLLADVPKTAPAIRDILEAALKRAKANEIMMRK